MSTSDPVIIVGAGAAGLSAAESLRGAGYRGTLRVVGNENQEPYDRPPLSKQVLAGTWAPERATLLPERRMKAIEAEWVLGQAAVSLVAAEHRLELADGSSVEYSHLVVATGVRPRTLPHPGLSPVLTLRTLDDALRLRDRMVHGGNLVVVGGGFLGLEAAATASGLGMRVVVVEPVPGDPLTNRIGRNAAAKLAALHRANGVDLITGVGVVALSGGHEVATPFATEGGEPGDPQPVRAVHLSDGTTLPADLVLVAIGSEPCTDWLTNSGLTIDNGVVCDEYCSAGDDVWAAGDVARWMHGGLQRHVRLEHRMNATEQGRAVALNILGRSEQFRPVPYFWSDHYDVKIQLSGVLAGEATIVAGSPDEDSFVETYTDAGTLVGVLGWNAARAMVPYRRELAQSLSAVH